MIEIGNNVIYEQNYKSKYMIIYAIESYTQQIDKKLIEMSFGNN